jgi:hypothetical protein
VVAVVEGELERDAEADADTDAVDVRLPVALALCTEERRQTGHAPWTNEACASLIATGISAAPPAAPVKTPAPRTRLDVADTLPVALTDGVVLKVGEDVCRRSTSRTAPKKVAVE